MVHGRLSTRQVLACYLGRRSNFAKLRSSSLVAKRTSPAACGTRPASLKGKHWDILGPRPQTLPVTAKENTPNISKHSVTGKVATCTTHLQPRSTQPFSQCPAIGLAHCLSHGLPLQTSLAAVAKHPPKTSTIFPMFKQQFP